MTEDSIADTDHDTLSRSVEFGEDLGYEIAIATYDVTLHFVELYREGGTDGGESSHVFDIRVRGEEARKERNGVTERPFKITEHSIPQDDLEPRTRRAVDEEMAVSLLEKGGRYEVRSTSGNQYEVDVISESCTCPDWRKHTPEGGCKHLRRVDHEIK